MFPIFTVPKKRTKSGREKLENSENRKSVEETHVDQNGRDGLNWFQLVDAGLKTSTSTEKKESNVLDALKWME